MPSTILSYYEPIYLTLAACDPSPRETGYSSFFSSLLRSWSVKPNLPWLFHRVGIVFQSEYLISFLVSLGKTKPDWLRSVWLEGLLLRSSSGPTCLFYGFGVSILFWTLIFHLKTGYYFLFFLFLSSGQCVLSLWEPRFSSSFPSSLFPRHTLSTKLACPQHSYSVVVQSIYLVWVAYFLSVNQQ